MSKRNAKKLAELAPYQDPQDRVVAPTSVADQPETADAYPVGAWVPETVECEGEGEEVHGAALWRVEGDESGSGGGGVTFFYVLTDDCLKLPDCCAAHDSLAGGCAGGGLYNLRRVEKVADHFTEDDETAYAHGCVNQTGRPMTADVAALIASLMRSLKSAEDELGKARLELRRMEREAAARN